MSDNTPLEAEAQGDTATFEKFGRSWSVPTKRNHRHIIESKRIIRTEGFLDSDDIAALFLSEEDYKALVDLNVSESDLGDLATEIANAMGLGSAGNSEPS